jgi:hypothetical protein
MSTALITALRESCGYLRDGGYRQTARLLVMAADEIERLNERVRLLEDGASAQASVRERRAVATAVPGQSATATATDLPPARRSVSANR